METSSRSSSAIAVVVIGMAGGGKTTFVETLYLHLHQKGKAVYTINLDPAVQTVPFPTNIDIRDTVNYKEVMKQYKLGPNGAILTSLNLFSTQIDGLIALIERRAPKLDFILIDTPGQIEVFNWSASGSIILDSLAVTLPTIVVYLVDSERCQHPITFMSNMLYACSLLYKTKLPFVACFNKTDVVSHKRCLDWMESVEEFQEATRKEDSYMASFSFSCALTLCEFYKGIKTVGVSAATGAGMCGLEDCLRECAQSYETEYRPLLEKQRKRQQERTEKRTASQLKQFEKDVIDDASTVAASATESTDL